MERARVLGRQRIRYLQPQAAEEGRVLPVEDTPGSTDLKSEVVTSKETASLVDVKINLKAAPLSPLAKQNLLSPEVSGSTEVILLSKSTSIPEGQVSTNKKRKLEEKKVDKYTLIQRELNFLTSSVVDLSSSSESYYEQTDSTKLSRYIPVLTARDPSEAVGIELDSPSEWDHPPSLSGPFKRLKTAISRHYGFNAASFSRNTRLDAGPILPVHHGHLSSSEKKEQIDLVKRLCSTSKGHEDLRIGTSSNLIENETEEARLDREQTFRSMRVPGLDLGKLKSGLVKLRSLDSYDHYESVRISEMEADRDLPQDQRTWKILKPKTDKHLYTSIRDENGVAVALVRWGASMKARPDLARKEKVIMMKVDEAFQVFCDNVKGEKLDLIGSRGVHLTHHCYSRGLSAIQYDFEGCPSRCWDERRVLGVSQTGALLQLCLLNSNSTLSSPFIVSGPTYNHHFVNNLRHWLWFLKTIEPLRERMHKEVYAFFPSFTNYVEGLWDHEAFQLTHAPLFYPWTGLAFNVGNSDTESSAVTDPHVDSKDDPNGICGVYCWGKWNWKKGRGALILPECKTQVNLRPGDTIYFYSGRLVHYNLPVRKDAGEYRSSFVANVSNTLLSWFEAGQQKIGDNKALALMTEEARKARMEENLRGTFHDKC